MIILRAEHLGMCFGVRDAIARAQEHAQRGPLTVLGDLVHNPTVIHDLESRGVRITQDPAAVTTRNVMITAHGTSDHMRATSRALGLNVIEGTCPLVHHAHRALHALVRDGCHPIIIGKRDHVEVRGLTGDLERFDVVLNEADVQRLQWARRFGIVAQTTQPADRVRHLVTLIEKRFPEAEIHFRDTVCEPTKRRQRAAVELAHHCDVVIVVGGLNSNNTHELVRTCRRDCERVHHVQTAADLRLSWFGPTDRVGLTAGTSTPDLVIAAVERRLLKFAEEMEAHSHSSVSRPAPNVTAAL